MNEEIKVRDLVHQLYAATERMSRKNSHRALMLHSMSALMQLTKQVEALKQAELDAEPKPEPSQIICV